MAAKMAGHNSPAEPLFCAVNLLITLLPFVGWLLGSRPLILPAVWRPPEPIGALYGKRDRPECEPVSELGAVAHSSERAGERAKKPGSISVKQSRPERRHRNDKCLERSDPRRACRHAGRKSLIVLGHQMAG